AIICRDTSERLCLLAAVGCCVSELRPYPCLPHPVIGFGKAHCVGNLGSGGRAVSVFSIVVLGHGKLLSDQAMNDCRAEIPLCDYSRPYCAMAARTSRRFMIWRI